MPPNLLRRFTEQWFSNLLIPILWCLSRSAHHLSISRVNEVVIWPSEYDEISRLGKSPQTTLLVSPVCAFMPWVLS
jgi:hypothetical protein